MVVATPIQGDQVELLPEDSNGENGKSNRRGNVFMKRLEPEMLSEPYPIDVADGMMSDSFCYEKACREFVKPLSFDNKADWLSFCEQVWKWAEEAENRELDAKAEELMKSLASDPKLAERLKQKMQQTKPPATTKK